MPKRVEWLLDNSANPADPRQKGSILIEEDAIASIWSRQGKCKILGDSEESFGKPEEKTEEKDDDEREPAVVETPVVEKTKAIPAAPKNRAITPSRTRSTGRGRK